MWTHPTFVFPAKQTREQRCACPGRARPWLGSHRGTKQKMAFKQIRGSIVASISARHAEDPGSIPGRGVFSPKAEVKPCRPAFPGSRTPADKDKEQDTRRTARRRMALPWLHKERRKTHPRQNSHKHQWSSGRIHRCHRCDPGSIPG